MPNGKGLKNRVCHLTSVHPHTDTRIFLKECCSLAAAGFETCLIAPGAADGTVNGISLRGVPIAGTSRILRMTGTASNVYGAARSIDADIYHLHDPELIFVGMLLKALHRKKVIYDAHEDYPRSIMASEWIHPVFRPAAMRCVAFAEWLGSKIFDGIVAATPSIARRFPPSKTVTVQNFPISGELLSGTSLPYKQRLPGIAYVGSISKLRGAKEMIEAVGLLPQRAGLRLYLVGTFSPETLKNEVSGAAAWKRVEFLGWQPRKEVADVLGMSRMGLVLFHRAPNHISAQPNKLFEYMAAGIPVLASDFPLWREIVEKGKCGIVVDPEDPKAVSEAMQWLLDNPDEAENMGMRGRDMVQGQYNWGRESEKLIELYKRILQ